MTTPISNNHTPALSPSDNLALLTAAAAHNNIHITPHQNSP